MREGSPGEDPGGLAYGLAAYGAWGVLPLYFRALRGVDAAEILAHRAVWSVVFLAGLLTLFRGWGALRAARAALPRYALTALLIGTNWLVYIWCATHERVLDSSLGYFLNPLVNVVLGAVFLGERLPRVQLLAVALAAFGVAVQVAWLGALPWPAVVLPLSFGFYGLLRKSAPLPGVPALLLETLLLSPLALGWLVYAGQSHAPPITALLLGTGVVTALPLVWFGNAARRLSMATLGVLQYLSPTGQFLMAVFVFDEPWSAPQAATFACIWAALGLYAWGLRPGPAGALRGRQPPSQAG